MLQCFSLMDSICSLLMHSLNAHLKFYCKGCNFVISCSVIAVIAATLFPLWPAEMRVGVYYLSVGAGCFVASILLLAIGEYY